MDAGWRKPLYYSDQTLQLINITHSLSEWTLGLFPAATAGIRLNVLLLLQTRMKDNQKSLIAYTMLISLPTVVL